MTLKGSTCGISEQQKEKRQLPLLFKGGGHHTALLDFSFIDQFTQPSEDRGSGHATSRMSKLLASLFPNKIVVSPPKEGATVKIQSFYF